MTSSLRDGRSVYAAEEYELENEQAAEESARRNTFLRDYNEPGEEDESLSGEDTEDARAILLQNLDAARDPRPVLKSKEYDVSDDSAAAMVHRAVPETDDTTLTTFTFRVVLIGSLMCMLGTAISQLFFFKSNAPRFSSYFVILVTYPAGKWLAQVLPDKRIRFLRWSFSLNPGPWSYKEHLLVVVFATSGGTAFASDIISIQRLYYKQDIGVIAGMALLITTQLIGFGLSGFLQNILVRPVAMVFPQSLVYVTMFHALHEKGNTAQHQQMRMFALIFVVIFVYQIFPTVLFPTINSLAILCVINNKISVLRTLGSGFHGFGFLNLSFDWNSIGSVGPFFTPWWAQLNFFGGLTTMMWIITPAFYFANFWDALKFPSPISATLFNSSHEKFDVHSILAPDFTLNEEAWKRQGPLLLTPYFAITYALGFAALTSAVMHVILWHRGDIMDAVFTARRDRAEESIHHRLMEAYPPVPRSWYIGIFAITLVATLILIELAPLQLPAWGIFLAIFVAMVFLVPVGIISAVSETTIGLNIVTEFIAGFLIPGKPIANVVFKCYGIENENAPIYHICGYPTLPSYMAMAQALSLTSDLKLSVYMKIPPRQMFITQVLGTVLGCIVNYFTLNSVINAKFEYLDGTKDDPTGQWTGRLPGIFYSASVIWGLVGPARFFAGKYSVLYFGFLAGAALPIIPWWLHRKYPRRSFDKISIPIICHAAGLPPQIPTNIITTGFAAAYFSQVYLRRRRPSFFEKYNYVLSAALDAGTSVNALAMYLLLAVILGGWEAPHWWMNSAQDVEHCKVGS